MSPQQHRCRLAGRICLVIAICASAAKAANGQGVAAPDTTNHVSGEAKSAPFRHPGLLHTRDDLDRMRDKVAAGEEPWASGMKRLRADRYSSLEYRLQGPRDEIGRNPGNSAEFDNDANAAYQCVLVWCITGDKAYAAKSLEIVSAWSKRLKRVTGADAVLMAGLGPFKMINAAEILRATYPEWSEQDSQQIQGMLIEAIYPALKGFAPYANGNWDTAAVKTIMAIGIFTDDREMFERAVRYYVNGAGNGRITNYIINEEGQCQESGRDTQHSQLGLAHLGDCCEMAWNQGLDLYTYAGNRLLAGFEFTAKFNLGEDVPFVDTLDRTGQYHHTRIAVDANRGRLRPVYEQIFNHYVQRMGIAAPWTQKAAEKIRPEGAARTADHPGFGTLLFSRRPAPGTGQNFGQDSLPVAPAGLIADGSVGGRGENRLSWVESIGALSYTIKRAASRNGSFEVLARDVKAASYVDKTAEPGTLYRYTVSATNTKGESDDALPTMICAGLPAPWASAEVGAVAVPGRSSFDGETFAIEGAGQDVAGKSDSFQWASLPVIGDGAIAARFLPGFNSQRSKLGLMVRVGQDADAAHVSLLFANVRGSNVDRPSWRAFFVVRSGRGDGAQIVATSPSLPAPFVMDGRMLEPYWLKLERSGDTYVGSISRDGRMWSKVGSAEIPLRGNLRAGIFACSSLGTVTTRVIYDHVSAFGWTPEWSK